MVTATGEINEYLKNGNKTSDSGRWKATGTDKKVWHKQLCEYMIKWVEEHKDGRDDTWTNNNRHDVDFIEYTGDRVKDRDNLPFRQNNDDVIETHLYCDKSGCNMYIKGTEGYNGKFTAETGQQCDLRNQVWYCKNHQPAGTSYS